MLLTYYNFKFSVSSNFIVLLVLICLLVFGSLYQVLEMKKDVMISFLFLFLVVVVTESSLRLLSSFCFYSCVLSYDAFFY